MPEVFARRERDDQIDTLVLSSRPIRYERSEGRGCFELSEEVSLAPDGNYFARILEGGLQRGNVQRVVEEPRRRVDTQKHIRPHGRMLVAFRATILVRPKSPEEGHVRRFLGAHGLCAENVLHPGPVVIADIFLLHIPLAQYSGEETFDLEV